MPITAKARVSFSPMMRLNPHTSQNMMAARRRSSVTVNSPLRNRPRHSGGASGKKQLGK
jgi:hypothetical protein